MSILPLGLSLSLAVFNPGTVPNPQIPTQVQRMAQSVKASSPQLIAKAMDPKTGLPVVEGKQWDRQGPWFQPVVVQDSGGSYLAVLDKQKQGSVKLPQLTTVDKFGVFSSWSSDGIRLVGNGQYQFCIMVLCGTNYPRVSVEGLEVKVGDQVFYPRRGKDKFLVDEELAQALRTATPGKVFFRVHLTPGVSLTEVPNEATVKAWSKIFQEPIATDPGSAPIGGANLPTAKTVAVEPFPTLPKDSPSNYVVTDSKTGLPLVNGATWRTRRHIAWSTPVTVRDEFDGEYKAVFHKDGGFTTSWSRDFVDVFAKTQIATAMSFSSVPSLHITVGGRTLNLYGKNNRFYLNKMATDFLREAGEKVLTEKPTISYYTSGGNKRSYEIDIPTVKTWPTLYQ
jgi:hypothetical protein